MNLKKVGKPTISLEKYKSKWNSYFIWRIYQAGGAIIELVDRSQLGDVEYLKKKYEWLLRLSDTILVKEVDNGNIQNALNELLRFIDEVNNLPVLEMDCNGEYFDQNLETTDEWLDMN